MTRDEFRFLEKVCKDEWLRKIKENDVKPSKKMNIFSCECPACEISLRTTVGRKAKGRGSFFNCIHCPIKDWQILAGQRYKIPICENRDSEKKQAHLKFYLSKVGDKIVDQKMFLSACKEIVRKEWKWLSAYKAADVSDLINFLKNLEQ